MTDRVEFPSIDWSHVPNEYKYLAVDENEVVYVYENKPTLRNTTWNVDKGKYTSLKGLKSLNRGNIDWRFSLITRGYEGKPLVGTKWVEDIHNALTEKQKVEILTNDMKWILLDDDFELKSSVAYRIVSTKPSIDWDQIKSDYVWLYKDKFGIGFVSSYKPVLYDDGWGLGGRVTQNVSYLTSYKPGACNWKDSLVLRSQP